MLRTGGSAGNPVQTNRVRGARQRTNNARCRRQTVGCAVEPAEPAVVGVAGMCGNVRVVSRRNRNAVGRLKVNQLLERQTRKVGSWGVVSKGCGTGMRTAVEG